MAFVDAVREAFKETSQPCDPELKAWARTQKNASAAWEACERADWMLWGLALVHHDTRELALLTAAVVREAVSLFPEGSGGSSRWAVSATDDWGRRAKNASIELCEAASDDACDEQREQSRADLASAARAACSCGMVPRDNDPEPAPGAALCAARALAIAATAEGAEPSEALGQAHRRLADIIRSLCPSVKAFFARPKPVRPPRPRAPVARTRRSPAAPTSGSRHARLLAAVYASPHDDGPRLAYADYLVEQGDPLGELIHLQLARARGKKGTVRKEQALVLKGNFWADHPSVLAAGFSRWEGSERGFPGVVRWFSSATPRRARMRGNPGWSTVRGIELAPGAPDALKGLAPLSLPSLRSLEFVGPESLSSLAGANLDLDLLSLNWKSFRARRRPLSAATGIAHVRHLELCFIGRTMGDTMARLALLELTGKSDEITLHGRLPFSIPDALDLFATLPANVRLFTVAWFGTWAQLERTDGGVALEATVHQWALDALVSQLSEMAPAQFSSVSVTLPAGGFQPGPRATAEERVARALARYAGATLHSPGR